MICSNSFGISWNSRRFRYMASVLVIALVTGSFGPMAQAETIVGLGAAGGFAGLQLGGEKFTISSGSTVVNGDVGKASGEKLTFSGGGTLTGTIFTDPDVTTDISGGSSASGGVVTQSMSGIVTDAINASTGNAALTADFSLASIDNSTGTLFASGVTIFDVTGNFSLSSSTLTLQGSASDFFLFNIDGTIGLSGGSEIILSGGITADQVLFNVIGAGSGLNFDGNSITMGTFLAVDRAITVSGGVHTGSFIAGGELKFQSGPNVTEQSIQEVPASTVIPVPAALPAGLVGLAIFGLRRRNRLG